MQKNNWLLLFFLGVFVSPSLAQHVNLSGNVTDKSSGIPAQGVNVYLKGTTLGTVTNVSGDFHIRNIKPGNYELIISCTGFERIKKELDLQADTSLQDIALEKSNSTLGEVVITGTGTPHHLKSAPVQTELISNKLVEQIAPSSFTDLMTGISPSFDFSPGAMGAFMQLNGLGNDYILVLVNGKRLYGDIGGQTDLNRINPANIERIEVVKGASSALYGSEAMGGVINIITKKAGNNINIQNSSRIGSYGEWLQHNSLDLNFGRFSSSTSFDRKETDGWQLSKYEISGDTLIATDAMAQNASDDYTINQKFSYAVSRKINVYLQGTTYEHNLKRPLTVGKYDYYYNDFNYSAGAKYLLNKTDYIEADWNSDNFKYYYKYNQAYKTYTEGQKEQQTGQTRDVCNLKGFFDLSEIGRLTIGAEYVNEELESAGRLVGEKADAYTLAVYAQDEITLLKKLNVVAGLRYVNHEAFGNTFTPKISALYKLNHINFRATYARGFKAPTMKELYYHYERSGTLYLGNPDLDPQTSNYYAGSVEYITHGISLSITAYQNDVKGLIDYQTVETSEEDAANGIKTTRQHFNIAKAGTKGIDFLFDIHLGAGFTIGGGYSYVDAQNKTDHVRLENVARNYANIRLGYQHNWKKYHIGANMSGRLQDKKFYEEDGDASGYNIWKFTTTHRLVARSPFDLKATAGIDNIFDYTDNSPYGSHYGTLNPGRTCFIGLTIGFSR